MIIDTKENRVYSLFEHVANEINRNFKGFEFNTRVKFVPDKMAFAIIWDKYEQMALDIKEKINDVYEFSMEVLNQKILENDLTDTVLKLQGKKDTTITEDEFLERVDKQNNDKELE